MIEDLLHVFYAKVRRDELLGPIFEAEVEDWTSHLDTMCAFGSAVTLMTDRYKGQPIVVHARLPGIEQEHFVRWLALCHETVVKTCPPDAAFLFVKRAERIAQSLQAGMAHCRTTNAKG